MNSRCLKRIIGNICRFVFHVFRQGGIILEKRIRKPNRLREYDYSRDGVYFITICTQNREPILSEIVDDDMRQNVGDGFPVPKHELMPVPKLKPAGYIVQECLNRLHEKYPMVFVDCYVIMPDHVHVLLNINGNMENKNGMRNLEGTGNPNGRGNLDGTGNPSPTVALGNVIGWFKYQTTKEINAIFETTGARIWQRSYYDHVIRGDADYWNIRQYIEENPARWAEKYNGVTMICGKP